MKTDQITSEGKTPKGPLTSDALLGLSDEELAEMLQPVDNPPVNGCYIVERDGQKNRVQVRDGWVRFKTSVGIISMEIDGMFTGWESIPDFDFPA